MKPNELWTGALCLLEKRTTAFSFEAWLQPLRVEESASGLKLCCPNAFHQGRVRDRFLKEITSCITEVAATNISVELVVDENPPALSLVQPSTPAPTSEKKPEPAKKNTHTSQSGWKTPGKRWTGKQPKGTTQVELPYSFSSFVTGGCNALAREASYALAVGGQHGVSPLFLSSASGMGKTHLARSVATQALQSGAGNVVCTSAEGFTGDFLTAVRNRQMDQFKRVYRRNCELLVIEDVQFLSGKSSTQMELFHTVEHLRESGVRVMFTSDRFPRDITSLDPRLCSHMTAGLVAEIEPPDAHVRREILRDRAARGGVHIPPACIELLVSSLSGSVRDLEGVLIQLVSSSALLSRSIDLELTENALKKVAPPPVHEAALDPEIIIDIVAKFFKTAPATLASRSRRREILLPRQLAMYLCHRYTDASFKQIGRALNKEHPSVSNAIRVIERRMLERAPLRYQVEAISSRIEQIKVQRSAELRSRNYEI